MIDRRDFLLAAGGAALACSYPIGAAARAPMATTQVPGFYRFSVGQFQVTVLSDGRFTLTPNGMFPRHPPMSAVPPSARTSRHRTRSPCRPTRCW